MGSNAFRPVPGAYYTFEYRGPLFVDGVFRKVYFRLGVKDSSQDDFASVITTYINTNDPIPTNQQFRFEELESGWFVIIARHSGKVLDVQGFSQDEGGTVIQYHRWDGMNQQWSISGIEPTKFVVRSRNSGKVLQMPLQQNNGQVRQHSFSDAERWTIHRVEAPPFVPERSSYYQVRMIQDSLVFDVDHSSLTDGANVQQWGENGTWTQQWRFDDQGNGWYALVCRNSGKRLDVDGGSTDDVKCFQWSANNGLNQHWAVQQRGRDYLLVNRKSGKAVSAVNFASDWGSLLFQKPIDPTTHGQYVDFEQVERQAFLPTPGTYYTLTFSHSGYVLAVSAGSTAEQASLVQLSYSGQPYAQWKFDEVEPGYYVISARHTTKVMAVLPTSNTEGDYIYQLSRDNGPNQQWSIGTSSAGVFLRNRQTGRVVDVDGISKTAGALIHQWTMIDGPNQVVTATAVSQPDFKPNPDAWYELRFAHSGKVMTVGLAKQTDGAVVWQAIDGGNPHQQWRFLEIEPGWFQLVARHSGKALDLLNGSATVGTQIQQWTRQDTNKNQHWALVPTPYGYAIVNRKTHMPIEVPADSQDHAALVKEGSGQWDQNQSLGIELFVTNSTLASLGPKYTVPNNPDSPLGVVATSEPTGGVATADPVVSTAVPPEVASYSPVDTAILGVSFSIPASFTGSVTQTLLSAGQAFEGPAQLPAPFSTSVDSLKLLVSTGTDAGKALAFTLPDTCSLSSIIDSEIIPKVGDAALQSVLKDFVRPFAALYKKPKIVLSTNVGTDTSYGSYLDGFNAFASIPISLIPPFDVVQAIFPKAGLDKRNLTLGIGTSNSINLSSMKIWVSGDAQLNLDLIPSFLVLKDLSLKLSKSSKAVMAAGELSLELSLPGEVLSLRGGVETVTKKSGTESQIWAAIDSTDGGWKNAFGVPGLNVVGMGLQVSAGGGFGVRGEVHYGSGLLGATVALRVDTANPKRCILDLYSEEGLDLPRLLQPLMGSNLDVSTVCNVALTQLQLYIAPNGGSIAGQEYPMGVAIGAKLQLWGFGCMAKGSVTSSGLSLEAKADPLVLRAGGVSFLELTDATDHSKGASFQFAVSSKKFGGSISARASLLDGTYEGTLQGVVSSKGFSGTLTSSTQAGLGIYQSTSITMEQGLFRFSYSPTISASIHVSGYRASVSVGCTITTECTSDRFTQSIAFSYSAMGNSYHPGPFSISVPFRNFDDLCEAFYRHAATLIAGKIADSLRSASSEAFAWVKSQISTVVSDCVYVFKGAGADATQVANGLKNYWNAGAQDVANAMSGAYSWTVDQTGTFLRDVYKLGASDLSNVLKSAGYATDSVQNLFNSWGGSFKDFVSSAADFFKGW